MTFYRNQVQALRDRLQEPPLFITIVAGPRQVGKTTLVRQAMEKCAHYFVAVDQPTEPRASAFGDFASQTSEIDGAPRDAAWLIRSWQNARHQCKAFKDIRGQLVAKYGRESASDGYGIFLVFWFTGNLKAAPGDGGARPKTPQELQQRLAATVPEALRHKIAVLVVDCSKPQAAKSTKNISL